MRLFQENNFQSKQHNMGIIEWFPDPEMGGPRELSRLTEAES
jgi:hypothetical protein